jgi:hypothetical protein
MKQHKRTITKDKETEYEIDFIGYNSNGVLTLVCGDLIFNFNKEELYKLKKFIGKINI